MLPLFFSTLPTIHSHQHNHIFNGFLEIVPVFFPHTKKSGHVFPMVRLEDQLTLLPKTSQPFQTLLFKLWHRGSVLQKLLPAYAILMGAC